MTSAAPARKPYRKAPPQHRETRHVLSTAPPPPAPQPDINQVNKHTLKTPPHTPPHLTRHATGAGCQRLRGDRSRPSVPTSPRPLSDSELEVSSLSSVELCTPPPLFSGHTQRTHWTRRTAVGVTASDHETMSPHQKPRPQCGSSPRHAMNSRCNKSPCPIVTSSISTEKRAFSAHRSPTPARKDCNSRGEHPRRTNRTRTTGPPKGILKQPTSLRVEHTYDIIRKSKSVEMLDENRGQSSTSQRPPTCSLDRVEHQGAVSRRSSAPPSPNKTNWNWRMQALEEKVRFSNFLDEITCRVLSPAHLTLLGRAASREYVSPASQRPRCRPQRVQQVEGLSADRTRRWDDWVAALQRPGSWYQNMQEGGRQKTHKQQADITGWAGPKRQVRRGVKMEVQEGHKRPLSNLSLLSHIKVGPHHLYLPSPCLTPPSPCLTPPSDHQSKV